MPALSSQYSVFASNYTQLNFLYRKRLIEKKDFGAIDSFVMVLILIATIAVSMGKLFTVSDESDVDSSSRSATVRFESNFFATFWKVVKSSGKLVAPYVNTLCLFGLSGEVFKNGISVIYILLGVALSVPFLHILHFYQIADESNVHSLPDYFKKRFQKRAISIIATTSAILRHFIGGTLNLCVMCIGVSALTGVSPFACSIAIASTAVTCSSVVFVLATKINSGNRTSIGGALIWVLGGTCLVTLSVTTWNNGGLTLLLERAANLNKLKQPSIALNPWKTDGIWGFIFIGMNLGLLILGFSRPSLAHLNRSTSKTFRICLFVTFLFILVWTLLGVWAGLCVAVAFGDTFQGRPDGLLARLVSVEMENVHGFRGFFVSVLLGASTSGLTRRFNQVTELVWETVRSCKALKSDDRQTLKRFIETHKNRLSDEYLKELRWKERKTSCLSHFAFKFFIGANMAILSCTLVYVYLRYNVTSWQLWQSVLGIFVGPLTGILIMALLCPCVSHISICLGLLVGWAVPSYILISNTLITSENYFNVENLFLDDLTLKVDKFDHEMLLHDDPYSYAANIKMNSSIENSFSHETNRNPHDITTNDSEYLDISEILNKTLNKSILKTYQTNKNLHDKTTTNSEYLNISGKISNLRDISTNGFKYFNISGKISNKMLNNSVLKTYDPKNMLIESTKSFPEISTSNKIVPKLVVLNEGLSTTVFTNKNTNFPKTEILNEKFSNIVSNNTFNKTIALNDEFLKTVISNETLPKIALLDKFPETALLNNFSETALLSNKFPETALLNKKLPETALSNKFPETALLNKNLPETALSNKNFPETFVSNLERINLTFKVESFFILDNLQDIEKLKKRLEKEKRLTQTRRKTRRYIRKTFSLIEYMYFGPLGCIASILTSLIFSGIIRKCTPHIEPGSESLLHERALNFYSRENLLMRNKSVVHSPEETRDRRDNFRNLASRRSSRKEKRKKALNTLFESTSV